MKRFTTGGTRPMPAHAAPTSALAPTVTNPDTIEAGRHRPVSRHGSDVVGYAQPSERSARRIARPLPSVLASDATPRRVSLASADRQMIGGPHIQPAAPPRN